MMEDDIDKEKPPDKVKDNYKCIKVNLLSILKDNVKNDTLNEINNAVVRCSRITQKTYLLLRLWVLKKYTENVDIPIITDKIISVAANSLLKNFSSERLKDGNITLYKEFKDLHNFDLEDGKYMKVSLNAYYKTMVTSIENNIKNNYLNFINRFINSYFKKVYEEEIKDKKFKDNLMKELHVLKEDIKNGTTFCNEEYHEWLNEHRKGLIPSIFSKNIHHDIKTRPQRYLKHMIYMNLELESIGAKMFQFFPLQSSCIPVHFQFDSFTISQLLVKDTLQKKFYKDNYNEEKSNIWNLFFKINKKIKNYIFDNTIITDGYSASIRFIERNFNETLDKLKDKLRNGRNKTKGLSMEERIKIGDEKKEIQEEKEVEYHKEGEEMYLNNKENNDKKIENNSLLKELKTNKKKLDMLEKKDLKKPSFILKNEDEIKKIKESIKVLEEKINNLGILKEEKNESEKTELESKKIKKKEEFPYIDEVDETDLEGTHIFIDPGKRSLLTMMNDEGKFLSYTNQNWVSQTCRLKYQKRLENYKKKHDNKEINESKKILKNEELLSDLNSKTCNYDNFKYYIEKKVEVNNKINSFYETSKFRQYKWYGFINRKRALDKMLNLIEDTYNSDGKKKIKIIIGDWSIGKSMRHFISTPNLTIKRKLKERFKHVYNIDEFRTSCLSYKTEKKCENLYLKLPNRKHPDQIESRKMHAILTYKMDNNRLACINRDKNGCKNIQKIFNSFIETGERPYNYRRDVKLDETKLPANPEKSA